MSNALRDDLRAARRRSGLTFTVFASLAGYTEAHLRNVENGNRALTVGIAKAYDRVLNTGGTFQTSLLAEQGAAPAAWNATGVLEAASSLLNGDSVEQQFTGTAAELAARWQAALSAATPLASGGARRIDPALVEHIDQRLGHLRVLDDQLGSGDLARLAGGELALIVGLLRHSKVPDRFGRRLHSLAAEAARQAAWSHFDQGRHSMASRYFELALRASAVANDPITGAYSLSFLAVQCYSTGRAQQAISLLETARESIASEATPRMRAMLAARAARALSKAGDRQGCARQLRRAQTALQQGPSPDDPPTLYWVTQGEIEMIAGSSALELGDPREALLRFDAAIHADYRGDDQYPRSHAIYLARAAEAHLALHDLDSAVATARHATRCLGDVDSARSSATLSGMRAKFARHAASPLVRDFLEVTR